MDTLVSPLEMIWENAFVLLGLVSQQEFWVVSFTGMELWCCSCIKDTIFHLSHRYPKPTPWLGMVFMGASKNNSTSSGQSKPVCSGNIPYGGDQFLTGYRVDVYIWALDQSLSVKMLFCTIIIEKMDYISGTCVLAAHSLCELSLSHFSHLCLSQFPQL